MNEHYMPKSTDDEEKKLKENDLVIVILGTSAAPMGSEPDDRCDHELVLAHNGYRCEKCWSEPMIMTKADRDNLFAVRRNK